MVWVQGHLPCVQGSQHLGGYPLPTAKTELAPISLASKLAKIADAIGEKEPVRHSRDIKFPYHAAKDVYGWWRPLLHAEGIIIVPSVADVGVIQATLPRSGGGTRVTFLTTMTVRFTVIDGVSGEIIEGSAVGQGEDPSDKGSGKAMTYAEKAFLLGMGMNGSESDVEAYSDHSDEEREERSVRVESSSIEGIERGGRSVNATEVQVRRVREMAGELGLDPDIMAGLLEQVLEVVLPLPEDPGERGPVIRKALEGLSAEDIGKLIQYMEIMSDKNLADASASPY